MRAIPSPSFIVLEFSSHDRENISLRIYKLKQELKVEKEKVKESEEKIKVVKNIFDSILNQKVLKLLHKSKNV